MNSQSRGVSTNMRKQSNRTRESSRFTLVIVLLMASGLAACSPRSPQSEKAKGPSSKGEKQATITADPNPIQVCDGSGAGISKLTWTAARVKVIEIHVNSPNGDLLARTGANGMAMTGKWAVDGMTFYLQDVSDGKSLTPDNTLATVTVKVTTDGCP